METAVYHVNRVLRKPSLSASIREDVWQAAEECRLENFRPESSNHRPVVSARLVHDGSWLYGLFSVQDRYVRSVQTAYGSAVCTDSCVEFFVKPKADRGYFNFEFNAGGTLHCSYITDPRRSPAGGFRAFTLLPEEQGRMVKVRSTLPAWSNRRYSRRSSGCWNFTFRSSFWKNTRGRWAIRRGRPGARISTSAETGHRIHTGRHGRMLTS